MLVPKVLLSLCIMASALAGTPVGRWKTYDDKTGQVHGLVEITEEQGLLKGRILKSYDPLKPNPTCDLCEGEAKGKPVLGLVFLWGLKPDGEEFKGGFILDPDNGKVYKAKLSLEEGGRKLRVRGFIGISLIGRTQIWVREE